MKKFIFIAFLAFALIGISTITRAEEKLVVISDQQKIDYAKRVLSYQGNVEASWENYIFKASQLEIYLTEKNTLERIVAMGGVKITQNELMQASCQKIVYTASDGLLILEGDVNYKDNLGNTLLAQKVSIWTLEKKLEAEGTPVKATYIVGKGVLSGTPSKESK